MHFVHLNHSNPLLTLTVVYTQTDNLAGWASQELVALLGVYFIVLGAISMVVAPSLQQFMENIVTGNLDYTLTKPADAQVLVSISEVRIWRVIDLVLGIVVLAIALSQMAADVGLLQALLFGLTLLIGAGIVYSVWIMLATMAFWFIRVENILQVFWALFVAGRWPVTIYPGWLRWALTLLVPVAFAVTVPAEAIAGRLDVTNIVTALVMCAVLLTFSRWFWKQGLRHYGGASA